MPNRDPRSLALDRLALREHSAAEMRAYLARKGVSEAEASELVESLVTEGAIDDDRYARVVARHQALRDRGPGYILMKLRQKGVRADLRETQELYSETSGLEEIEVVRSIVERRYPASHQDEKAKARAYQGLIRRGFSRAAIQKVLFKGREIE